MFESILEWRPPWESPAVPWVELFAIVLVQAATLLALALNPCRRWSHIAWVLVTMGSYPLARRNVWPMFIVSLAVLAANARVLETERVWAGSPSSVRTYRWGGGKTRRCWSRSGPGRFLGDGRLGGA